MAEIIISRGYSTKLMKLYTRTNLHSVVKFVMRKVKLYELPTLQKKIKKNSETFSHRRIIYTYSGVSGAGGGIDNKPNLKISPNTPTNP